MTDNEFFDMFCGEVEIALRDQLRSDHLMTEMLCNAFGETDPRAFGAHLAVLLHDALVAHRLKLESLKKPLATSATTAGWPENVAGRTWTSEGVES